MATKPGLYANINAKRERIAAGSGEKDAQARRGGRAYGKSVPRVGQDGQTEGEMTCLW
jgi:hypothetical protein